MKAAVIRRHGGPEAIELADLPDPEPGPGEAVVDLKAASLDHLDVWVRRGGRMELAFPHVIGSDGAGVVSAVGESPRGVSAGDEVIVYPGIACGRCEFCRAGEQSMCAEFGIVGMDRPGLFAGKVCLPIGCLAPKPAYLSFEEAASLCIAYLTAWRMLTSRAGLRPGETVLIHGIGGGVALAGLQIAKLCSARVIVTSSSDEKLARAAELGADEGINYRESDDLASRVRELTDGRGVDVAFDTVGAATWPVDLAALRRGGRVVICGVTSGAEAVTDLQALYWNQLTALGSTLGSYEDLRAFLAFAAAAELHPVIDSTRPLDEARAAAERMEAGEQFGKIVLTVP
jgi:NADPH:quinone reductase-like Zn-dependent oxidoreductase